MEFPIQKRKNKASKVKYKSGIKPDLGEAMNKMHFFKDKTGKLHRMTLVEHFRKAFMEGKDDLTMIEEKDYTPAMEVLYGKK